jgi:hypothetical protein
VAKQSGLGDRLFVAGYNLSGDITAIGNVGGGPAALDCTGIDKSAFERIGGIRDGRIEATSWFNPTANMGHDRFSALPTADQIVTYCRGAAVGSPAVSVVGKQVNYDGSRGNDGAFTFEVATQAAAGIPVEWGVLGTAGVRTDTTATNGASVDHGAATSHGLAAYLHVFAFTGTSVTVKLQESSDDGGADTWADVTGGGFTAATGVTSERIQTATGLAVERYLRVVTTGTFSNAQFAVQIVRHEVARDY